MTCDQVGIINNPHGVLETKACTVFHRQALIGASQCPLLLREDKKDKGQTLFLTSHTSGAIWSESSYLMPSSTFPGLGGSQIEPILPPTHLLISKVILSLTTALIELPYWYALLSTREQVYLSRCWWVEWCGSWPPKPGTEWERSLWFLPQGCVLLHELDAQIIVLGFSQVQSLFLSICTSVS